MLFIGLDLAWGQKNTSGGVILRANASEPALVADVQPALGDDAEILRWIAQWQEPGALLIGVDAPLIVRNETGRRPAEAEIGRRFAKFQAGAHPANRQRFGGYVRGEELVAALAPWDIKEDPYLEAVRDPSARRIMEVFPHRHISCCLV